jgi:tRNA U55 pseudouridine synthase TruB
MSPILLPGIAIAANNLIVNTESLLSKIEVATEGTIGQFSQKLELSKDAIDKIVKDGVDRLSSNIENIELADQKLKETAVVKVNEVSGLASNSIEKVISQSLTTIKDVSSLSKSAIEEQKNENLKTLNQILETHNQIKQLIGQLLDFDLPKTLKSLNNNIEKQQKQSEIHFQVMKKMQTWSLIGFGVLVVVMIVFKFL